MFKLAVAYVLFASGVFLFGFQAASWGVSPCDIIRENPEVFESMVNNESGGVYDGRLKIIAVTPPGSPSKHTSIIVEGTVSEGDLEVTFWMFQNYGKNCNGLIDSKALFSTDQVKDMIKREGLKRR